jgi:GAF domain-containing protein
VDGALGSQGRLITRKALNVVPDSDDRLHASLSPLSGVLLAEQTVDEILGTVVELAKTTVQGADGVSVTVVEDGDMSTSHATDDVVRELDGVQYRSGDGPCVAAIREGESIHFDTARDRSRYPAFAAAADQRFIVGVLSTPLAVGERVFGGINCYSASTERFGADEADVAAQLARQAAVVLANAATLAEATTTAEQLHQAMLSRDLIGQAKGMLMERQGCTAAEAFDILRRTSQRENKKLTVVASELVERRLAGDG